MPVQVTSRRGVLRAVVFDNQPLWRDAFSSMLTRLGMGSVVACESLADFSECLRSQRPHVVVVDPDEVPGVAEEVEAAQELLPELTTVVVSARRKRGLGRRLQSVPFVTKRRELPEIEAALLEVIRERVDLVRLTPRELEVLRIVAGGASNREVAHQLWLSDQTVKFHLARAYRKLGVRSRRDAVARARAAGLLPDAPAAGGASAAPR